MVAELEALRTRCAELEARIEVLESSDTRAAADTFGVVAMVVPNWGIAFGNPYEGQSVGDNELGDADCISGVAGDIGVCSAASIEASNGYVSGDHLVAR